MDDLIATFPEETDLPAMKGMIECAIKFMGTNTPREMFDSCVVVPYGDRMRSKDESFFLEECSYDTNYTDINIVNKLKKKWRIISADNKEIVWKYFHLLIILNEKCK
jgi:hypothetical protein